MVLVIGHRGASGYEPENTMRSFFRAIALGCDMVELDVHMTRDGRTLVMHDDTVDRTTNGSGKISEMDLEEIEQLDAGMGEKVPLLEEVLSGLSGKCMVNIELKGSGTAVPVSELLEKEFGSRRWNRDEILISSFSPLELKDFIDIGSGITTAFLIDRDPWGSEEFANQVGAQALHPNYHYLSKSFVEQCRELGLKVNTWTVNDKEAMETCISMGVDGIITDRPDILVENVMNRDIG